MKLRVGGSCILREATTPGWAGATYHCPVVSWTHASPRDNGEPRWASRIFGVPASHATGWMLWGGLRGSRLPRMVGTLAGSKSNLPRC